MRVWLTYGETWFIYPFELYYWLSEVTVFHAIEAVELTGKPLVSIVSAGMSKFGKRVGMYGRELFAEAASEAFEQRLAAPGYGSRDLKAELHLVVSIQ